MSASSKLVPSRLADSRSILFGPELTAILTNVFSTSPADCMSKEETTIGSNYSFFKSKIRDCSSLIFEYVNSFKNHSGQLLDLVALPLLEIPVCLVCLHAGQ